MASLAIHPQASSDRDRHNYFNSMNNEAQAQEDISTNMVGATVKIRGCLSYRSDFDSFQRVVKQSRSIHGGIHEGSGSESLSSSQPALEAVEASRCHSLGKHNVKQSKTSFNAAMLNQCSAAHLRSARSSAGRNATFNANVLRLLNSVPPEDWANTTTIMLRNIPAKYNRKMLLTELETAGFIDGITLLYLPTVKKTATNRGYAFIDFVSPNYAWAFKYAYEGRSWAGVQSTKVANVSLSNTQGFEANYALYSKEWTYDPDARPWINTKLISCACPSSFARVAPFATYEVVGSECNAPRGVDSDSCQCEPAVAHQTEYFTQGDVPMQQIWYL